MQIDAAAANKIEIDKKLLKFNSFEVLCHKLPTEKTKKIAAKNVNGAKIVL